MRTKTGLGLIGVVGIWLTAGFALPFVNVLKAFSPEQLMVFRGFLTAAMAFVLLRGAIGKVDKYTWLIALTLPFATLGLFQGIRHWGAGPTIIIITATPIVNFAVSFLLGRRVSGASVIGFMLVLGGVVIARWGGHFQWEGFAWTVFGTVMNGLLYEFFARAKAGKFQKCFYSSLGMGILGLVLSVNTPWASVADPALAFMLLSFAFVGGLLYWLANLLAFDNLPTTEASVLAQGETPAVIIGAYFMLGEELGVMQWAGVILSLFGAWYLSRWLAQATTETAQTRPRFLVSQTGNWPTWERVFTAMRKQCPHWPVFDGGAIIIAEGSDGNGQHPGVTGIFQLRDGRFGLISFFYDGSHCCIDGEIGYEVRDNLDGFERMASPQPTVLTA